MVGTGTTNLSDLKVNIWPHSDASRWPVCEELDSGDDGGDERLGRGGQSTVESKSKQLKGNGWGDHSSTLSNLATESSYDILRRSAVCFFSLVVFISYRTVVRGEHSREADLERHADMNERYAKKASGGGGERGAAGIAGGGGGGSAGGGTSVITSGLPLTGF